MPSRLPAVISATGSAMSAWRIQLQCGIAIAVIVSEHRAAPMRSAACTCERCDLTREPKYYDVTGGSAGIVSIMVGSLDDPSWYRLKRMSTQQALAPVLLTASV